MGYWQDERYFKNIDSEIRQSFIFQNIDPVNETISDEMMQTNSVSLHVRRGDYSSFGMSLIGEDYYCKAADIIKSAVKEPLFYIFSDDEYTARTIAEAAGIKYRLINHNRGKESY